jgi:branched-chain amino acid aminotransferase
MTTAPLFRVEPTSSPTPDARREEILAAPGFGVYFTDHMISATWTAEREWHEARLHAYGPLSVDPATAVLHYAQEIFEGLKAYAHDVGSSGRRPGWRCRSSRSRPSSGRSISW